MTRSSWPRLPRNTVARAAIVPQFSGRSPQPRRPVSRCGDELPPCIPKRIQETHTSHFREPCADVVIAAGVDANESFDQGGVKHLPRRGLIGDCNEGVGDRVTLAVAQACARRQPAEWWMDR